MNLCHTKTCRGHKAGMQGQSHIHTSKKIKTYTNHFNPPTSLTSSLSVTHSFKVKTFILRSQGPHSYRLAKRPLSKSRCHEVKTYTPESNRGGIGKWKMNLEGGEGAPRTPVSVKYNFTKSHYFAFMPKCVYYCIDSYMMSVCLD